MSIARMLHRGILQQIVLTALALAFLLPLLIAARVSLQGDGFGNYLTVIQQPLIPRFFINSVVVTAATIAIVYLITSLAGYAFSKLRFRGKEFLFLAVLVGLMIPSVALIVPLFFTVVRLQLLDNYLALILPYTALALPFTLLLMRNFVDGLPDEMIDAARVDGCNSLATWWYIIVPLTKPISMVVVIWTFLFSWNEYFLPLLFMQQESMQLVTQAPQFFYAQYTQDTGKIFAALILIALPVMVAYLSLQRYFQEGMVSGAGK